MMHKDLTQHCMSWVGLCRV